MINGRETKKSFSPKNTKKLKFYNTKVKINGTKPNTYLSMKLQKTFASVKKSK